MLPVLANLIYSEDTDTLADACWAISYLSEGPNDKVQTVIEAGVCRRLVELLMHEQFKVVSAALRAVGNIVTGNDVQTQVLDKFLPLLSHSPCLQLSRIAVSYQIVINCSVLPCLLHLLSSARESIRKEACWTISNITAGNRTQIQVLLPHAMSLPPLYHTLATRNVSPSPRPYSRYMQHLFFPSTILSPHTTSLLPLYHTLHILPLSLSPPHLLSTSPPPTSSTSSPPPTPSTSSQSPLHLIPSPSPLIRTSSPSLTLPLLHIDKSSSRCR